jgi:hypothetical protein
MTVKFTNNASATLATSINTSVTSISVTAGQGAQFPSLTSGEFFYATLVDSSNNLEIVKVTARSSDTLTVVRGQDSTTPRAYIAGDKIELRVVSAALNAMISDAATYSDTINTNLTNHLNDTSDAHDASAISFSPTGGIAATDVQAAIAELDSETPSNSGSGATGTWAIDISGNASTATTATKAGQVENSGGWNITPSSTTLFFNYNGTNVAKLDSSGNLTVLGNVTGYGTV